MLPLILFLIIGLAVFAVCLYTAVKIDDGERMYVDSEGELQDCVYDPMGYDSLGV